ncbi:hypothetical protein ABH926_004871 [Catenulispora sp. GP43]|uniref:DUF6348 family protein n=1 Tax=Catenulispora sp. GP43 TaxID=3156263 RepID=UPI00351838A7
MGWLKRQVSRSAPHAPAEPMSAAEFKLRLANSYLDAMFRPWFLDRDEEHGLLLAGPNASIVFLGSCENDQDPEHVRLVFAIANDDGTVTHVPDCVQIPGPDVNTALNRGVETWADTTARAVIGMFQGPRNRVGETFGPDHSHGVPGWTVSAGLIGGWGVGDEHEAHKDWFMRNPPWRLVAPHLLPDLDPARPNGVKFYLATSSASQDVEVRVNGDLHEAATRALREADWPRTEEMTVGRTFAMIVRAD